jgi:hypothetical protein
LGESDRKMVERSRGTATKIRAAGEGGSAGFRFGAGSRGLRGAGGHTAGGRSLLSSDVGVDGSSDEAGAGDGGDEAGAEAESSSDGGGGGKGAVLMGDEAAGAESSDGGGGGKGAVLMGGSAGKGSSA